MGELSSSAELLAITLSVTTSRATSPEGRGFKKELLYDETEVFYTVGTFVLGYPKRTTAGAVPGRNYKLLPALATNSPPDYSFHASRPRPTIEVKNV